MFTKAEKLWLHECILSKKSAIERAKGKARNPQFAELYDRELAALAALLLKVQAMEVSK